MFLDHDCQLVWEIAKKKLHKGEITAFSWKIPTVVYEQIGMAQRCNVAFYFNDEDKPVVESCLRNSHFRFQLAWNGTSLKKHKKNNNKKKNNKKKIK